MAISLLQDLDGMTPDIYDAVNAELGFPGKAPDGLIAHAAGQFEGGMRIVDVWESRDHFDRFLEQQVRPALAKVKGGDAVAPERMEQVELHLEWHR